MKLFNKNQEGAIDQSRQAVAWMHPEALVRFMTSRRWVINEGSLPEDAVIHHCYYDQQRQVFGVVLISSTFKQVKIGDSLPELPPITFRWWNAKDGEMA